jgi:uncharacterized protein (TIGR02147 family)
MKTQKALKHYFDRKKKSSPGFSMRSLARRLEISPSFLSRALNGKKAMPPDLQEKLVAALDVEPELFNKAEPEKIMAVEDWQLAEKDSLRILRNWYYIPVMEFTTLENFDGSISEIARRLGLSIQTAEITLRELTDLGLLKIVDGRPVKTNALLKFTSSKTVLAFRKFHDEMLEKSQETLRKATSDEDFQKRLITGITITANDDAIEAAKQKLAACLHEIASDLAAAPGTDVYQLSAQLFPLTRR